VIPGTLRQRQLTVRIEGLAEQNDQTEQAKQGRRGSFNRQVIPLALGFDPQMRPTFLKSDLNGPAFDDISDDGRGRLLQIG
jgi:hypothetical protein